MCGDDDKLAKLLASRKGAAKLDDTTLSRYRHDGVPIQEIGKEVMEWIATRRPIPKARPLKLPEELGRVTRMVTELYERTRGTGPNWLALNTVLINALQALPRVGERYRPPPGLGEAAPGS